MLDVVYTFYRGDYESLQSHTETTNNNSNNKMVRHVGAKQPPPTHTHKPCGTQSWLHLPSIAVVIREAVPRLQNLQKEPAKRQRSSCVAPGLPEELHTFAMRGAGSCLTALTKREAGGGGLQHPLLTGKLSGKGVGEKAWE